jgi:hypothetical protein
VILAWIQLKASKTSPKQRFRRQNRRDNTKQQHHHPKSASNSVYNV